MKKLLIAIVLLLSAGNTFAQNTYPNNLWGLRTTSSEHEFYFTQTSECLTDRTGFRSPNEEVVRFYQFNDDTVKIGEDQNNLVTYQRTGPNQDRAHRIHDLVGFTPRWITSDVVDGVNNNFRNSTNTRPPSFCNNRIVEVTNIRISEVPGHPTLERLQFSYRSLENTRVRIIVSGDRGVRELGSQNIYRHQIRWAPTGSTRNELMNEGATRSDDITIYVPKREIGDVWRLHLSPGENTDFSGVRETILTDPQYIVPGVEIITINNDFVEFVVAGSNDDPIIFVDKLKRLRSEGYDDDYWVLNGRRSGQFQRIYGQHGSYANGNIKRYRLNFGGYMIPYESVRLDVRVGGRGSNIQKIQMNGPEIRYFWTNNRPDNADETWQLKWQMELPPGWDASSISRGQIRAWGDTDYLGSTWPRDNGRSDTGYGGSYTNGVYTFDSNTWNHGWRFADNAWELGFRFIYRGDTYIIKMTDHITHGGNRLSPNRGTSGGFTNGPWGGVTREPRDTHTVGTPINFGTGGFEPWNN